MWRRDRNGDDRVTLVDFGIAAKRVGRRRRRGAAHGGRPHRHAALHGARAGAGRDHRRAHRPLRARLRAVRAGHRRPAVRGLGLRGAARAPRPAARRRRASADAAQIVPPAVDRLCAALLEKRPTIGRERGRGRRGSTARSPSSTRHRPADPARATAATGRRSRRGRRTRRRPRRRPAPRRSRGHRRGARATGAGRSPPRAAAPVRSRAGAGESRRQVHPPRGARAHGQDARRIRDEGELELLAVVPQAIVAGPDTGCTSCSTTSSASRSKRRRAGHGRPTGHEQGYAAESQGEPGHYHFHHVFAEPGRYQLRVFTSPPDTRFDVQLVVN